MGATDPSTWRRIGVFGGTFDPPHVGHLVAAINARHAMSLDVVLLVVAHQPWQKVGDRLISPSDQRLEVVRAAVGDVDGVEASDIEIRRGGASYTADTLAELATSFPEAELFLIVGADAAAGIATWERIEEVRDLATVVVVNRPGTARPKLGPDWRAVEVDIPQIEMSSTDLRQRAVDGRPLDFLIPESAVLCIRRMDMYS